MPLPTETYETIRDLFAQCLMQCDELVDLGLPEGNVFQADTLDSPDTKPFIVVRWSDEQTRLGHAFVTPVDLWIYDEFGDYNRATKLAKTAAQYLEDNVLGMKAEDGIISQVKFLGIGGDLADDGFKALVIPAHLRVVASGL